ncbi:hypothetical protein [Helicobacter pylori]|uniref:hypothetical protein n=1 Tax=Helicobacter pylori TaxID=210 RepID=UPI0013E2DBDE|nr:hypothetical protein [Helicobacter pylori]
MLEEAEEVIKAVASDCEFALARFEEKKCYIRNQVISEFSHHFNQLKGFELSNKKDSMENIQLCVTVSTLSSLSAFLKVPIMDKHQKLNKKAQNALNLMRNQINALESGQKSRHYDVAMIQSNQKGLKNL